MTQMKRIKPCVKNTQSRVEQFLLRVHLKTIEIPQHKTFVTFIMCNSQNNIIIRMSHQ